MIYDTKLDKETIHVLIRDAEHRNGFKLNMEDFDFLTSAVEAFVSQSIDKFISGAKEHFSDGDNFVRNVDHRKEMPKEVIDLWMYMYGETRRLGKQI